MGPKELLRTGKLSEAIRALSEELRSHPGDAQRRTFLFELLCFAGEFDRALKHLETLALESAERRLGAMLYLGAIHAEQTREGVIKRAPFDGGAGRDAPVRGILNGRPFESLQDADARIGPRLEVIAGGDYLWLPFRHVSSIEMGAPQRLRDLLWARAIVRTGPGFGGRELGEVLLPAICVSSWRHADEAVRLGRVTVWEEDEAGEEVPYGQKMLMVDDEPMPLLEVRRLEIQPPEGTPC